MSSQWCSKIRLLLRVRVNRFLEIFHLFLSLGLRKKRQYWRNNAIKRHTIKKSGFFVKIVILWSSLPELSGSCFYLMEILVCSTSCAILWERSEIMLDSPYFCDKDYLLTAQVTTWFPWKLQFQPGLGTRDLFNMNSRFCFSRRWGKHKTPVTPTLITCGILLILPDSTMRKEFLAQFHIKNKTKQNWDYP